MLKVVIYYNKKRYLKCLTRGSEYVTTLKLEETGRVG